MLRNIFRFNRNFYDTTYINHFTAINPSSIYNKNHNYNYQLTKNNPYNRYSTIPNRFDNYYNYQLSNYMPKFIDETYNHNYYEKNKYTRLIMPSLMIIYFVSSFYNNK
jgi:hypothetical protein